MKALDFILRGFLFLVFFSTGLGHFLETDFYMKMMPPYIPLHLQIVLFTGFCECLMGYKEASSSYKNLSPENARDQ